MKIELQHTADNSDQNSGEFAVHEGEGEKAVAVEVATRKHRLALTAGICGVLILGVVVGVLTILVGGSFKDDSMDASSEAAFDFTEVGSDSSNIRGSPTSAPTPTLATLAPQGATNQSNPSQLATLSPTNRATIEPSALASNSPTISSSPTVMASKTPTAAPTILTPEPTMSSQTRPVITPVNYTSPTLLTFCVIADVPYFDSEAAMLPSQIRDQMEDCEFLVHLGDIMRGEIPCDDVHYVAIKEMMMESTVPAFIVPGDNEWNDCGNNMMAEVAWDKWTNYFTRMEDNWNHTIPVVRNLDYPENFYFIQKRTLVFGLNIVGGRVHDIDEWKTRLTAEAEWVKAVVQMNIHSNADGVIVMAHAKPTEDHNQFFNPLRRLIRDDLANEVPFLYLHGDGHAYMYTRGFLNQPKLLRIQHEGGVRDPILKILADPYHLGSDVHSAFQVDRQLNLQG
jgi:hypothetical protein